MWFEFIYTYNWVEVILSHPVARSAKDRLTLLAASSPEVSSHQVLRSELSDGLSGVRYSLLPPQLVDWLMWFLIPPRSTEPWHFSVRSCWLTEWLSCSSKMSSRWEFLSEKLWLNWFLQVLALFRWVYNRRFSVRSYWWTGSCRFLLLWGRLTIGASQWEALDEGILTGPWSS